MSDDSFSKLLNDYEFKISKNNFKRFFKLAKANSEASDYKRQKLGAVITLKNKVLSVGWNTEKESAMQKKFNKLRGFDPNNYRNCAHAEMNAISKLLKFYNTDDIDFSKLNLFVYRENKSTHKVALARPCPACMAAIKTLGIKHLYYTGENSIISEVIHYGNE